MTLAYGCVLVAIILPYVCTTIAKVTSKRFNRRANHDPRAFQETLEGLPRRAHAAQLNSFEILPAFIGAVVIAHLEGGAAQGTLDGLALAFILTRLAYIACYLGDWARLRSLVWFVGLALIVALFVVAA
ncbi:MAPEG family protein [Pseudomonas sp. NPDC007930]|uniref:MAPEG family protein n=1 Tax=Pseudomonas sp. NPDC007930 TaxID=3364417 RepID=UPI0036EA46C5